MWRPSKLKQVVRVVTSPADVDSPQMKMPMCRKRKTRDRHKRLHELNLPHHEDTCGWAIRTFGQHSLQNVFILSSSIFNRSIDSSENGVHERCKEVCRKLWAMQYVCLERQWQDSRTYFNFIRRILFTRFVSSFSILQRYRIDQKHYMHRNWHEMWIHSMYRLY